MGIGQLHYFQHARSTELREGKSFAIPLYHLANTLRPLPVSRKDFMLESTRGQPQETLPAIFEPGLKLSWVTVRQTWSAIFSISKVTRDLSLRSSGSAQVNTNRLGGMLSTTSPVI